MRNPIVGRWFLGASVAVVLPISSVFASDFTWKQIQFGGFAAIDDLLRLTGTKGEMAPPRSSEPNVRRSVKARSCRNGTAHPAWCGGVS